MRGTDSASTHSAADVWTSGTRTITAATIAASQAGSGYSIVLLCEFDFESGGFELSVDEPLREPMESLSIRTAKGGSLLNRLGNASPRRLHVSYQMGGIDMDLGGDWVADAEITITGGTGGGAVHLPSGVILEGLQRRGIEARAVPEPKPPTLRFTVSTGIGRLEFAY